ncbi:MAG: SAM-dependent methyltransferase [Ruminococcaceae bacterium]|jgi:23S rRNA (cytosine1962-C5)-methyltransferase|nr:SAM-dependent methyltransferase [Oscillospiraceae bacterium]
MWVASDWKDYRLLDCGGGQRYEKWGRQYLVRPDPQAIWPQAEKWDKVNAVYHRSNQGGGSWEVFSLPENWQIGYGDLRFNIKPMSFKHTGVFPEQAANWDFIRRSIENARREISVLNLFAYTGGATLAAAAAGASVCHVDASRGMVGWAKENARSSGLGEKPIRWIVDDCAKFVKREINRGHRYDAIIMDPPSYGRGPSGELWRFEDNIYDFVELCAGVLSDQPLFVIISSYTAGVSPSVPEYILGRTVRRRFGGRTESGELGLPVESTGMALPCGHTTRWIGE